MSIVEPAAFGPLFQYSKAAEPVSAPASKYESTRDFACFAIGLCWLTVVISVAVSVWDCVSPFTVLPALAGIVPPLPDWASSILYDSAWFLAFALPLVLAMLIYRFSQNLHAIGIQGLSFSPAQASLSFFVPFLNLLLPGKVVAEFFGAIKMQSNTLLSVWQIAWIIVVFAIGAYACFSELIFYVPILSRNSALVVSAITWIPIQLGFAFFLSITAMVIQRLQARYDEAGAKL